ncbi:MAG: hypothetical protein WD208_06285 [Dehalococcoidia bacterium]
MTQSARPPRQAIRRPGFDCPNCGNRLEPKFLPQVAPSCPVCGAYTRPDQGARNSGLKVFCARCHTRAAAYISPKCTNCGTKWSTFSSISLAEQVPDTAFERPQDPDPIHRTPEGGAQ